MFHQNPTKKASLTWLHVLVLPALILMLVLAACDADDPNTNRDTEGGGGGLDPGGEPGADVPVGVVLVDGEIDMPSAIPAGTASFQITNAGTLEHSFEIESANVEESLASSLQPQESDALEVTLSPGTYEVYCPIDNHREQGMSLILTVE